MGPCELCIVHANAKKMGNCCQRICILPADAIFLDILLIGVHVHRKFGAKCSCIIARFIEPIDGDVN